MNLRECAIKAASIMNAFEIAAEQDAGFDAGEFSGPACAEAADRKIAELAESNGFTFDQVMEELTILSNEEEPNEFWIYGEDLAGCYVGPFEDRETAQLHVDFCVARGDGATHEILPGPLNPIDMKTDFVMSPKEDRELEVEP